MNHKVRAQKFSRDLIISVASPTLSNLPNILGGPHGMLSNPADFVQSWIPKPGCGFNCGNEERIQQFPSHPKAHKHQNNRRHPPPHSNGFHGNPHHQQWQDIRQPHPIYGAPYENTNWQYQYNQPDNYYYNNNIQQYEQHYPSNMNANNFQQSSFMQLPPTPNESGFIIDHTHEAGFIDQMKNEPNIVENTANQSFDSGLNAAITNIFEDNSKQTLNSGIIIPNTNQPNTIQVIPEGPAILESTEKTPISVNSPINNPDIIQLIPQQPQQPAPGQPEIVESQKNTETIFNPTKNNKAELKELPEQTVNPNEETNDFIYPDSARYVSKNPILIDASNIYPAIDIRRRRSVI